MKTMSITSCDSCGDSSLTHLQVEVSTGKLQCVSHV